MVKPELNWQPLSFLPQLAELIDDALENSEDMLQNFVGRDLTPVFDDDTVKRMLNAYREQRELLDVYDRQLKIWQESQCQLNQGQAMEISRLLKQLVKLKAATDKLLETTQRLQSNTIETIMGKSDVELAMEVLTGKRKL